MDPTIRHLAFQTPNAKGTISRTPRAGPHTNKDIDYNIVARKLVENFENKYVNKKNRLDSLLQIAASEEGESSTQSHNDMVRAEEAITETIKDLADIREIVGQSNKKKEDQLSKTQSQISWIFRL